jgi:hypothetical protein
MKSDPIKFGWFQTLDEAQMNSHISSLGQALLNADNGQAVHWEKNSAWGLTRVLYTDSNSQGYCRTVYIQVNAFNKTKEDVHLYCYDNPSESWFQRERR